MISGFSSVGRLWDVPEVEHFPGWFEGCGTFGRREGASSSAPCVVKDSQSLNEVFKVFKGLVDGCGGS